VHIFRDAGCDFTLLHCVSTYPCDEAKCNIRVIQGLRTAFDCKVGYSGHETGIMPSILAAALGAVAIERHITWDRSAPGSDQSASLERRGMELLAKYARGAQAALGVGIKRILDEEIQIARKLRYWE
jgi:N-acetylneuraminate synthase